MERVTSHIKLGMKEKRYDKNQNFESLYTPTYIYTQINLENSRVKIRTYRYLPAWFNTLQNNVRNLSKEDHSNAIHQVRVFTPLTTQNLVPKIYLNCHRSIDSLVMDRYIDSLKSLLSFRVTQKGSVSINCCIYDTLLQLVQKLMFRSYEFRTEQEIINYLLAQRQNIGRMQAKRSRAKILPQRQNIEETKQIC